MKILKKTYKKYVLVLFLFLANCFSSYGALEECFFSASIAVRRCTLASIL